MKYAVLVGRGNDRVGKIVELHEGESISIGRSWLCDVAINDPYLEGEHLKVSLDTKGDLGIEDLGTRNGTRLAKKRVVNSVPYQLGHAITMGETEISIVNVEDDVVPSLKYDLVQVAARTFQSFLWLIVAAVFALLGLLGTEYWVHEREFTNKALADSVAGFFALLVGWCGIAGIVGFLLRGRMLMNLHWIFVCTGSVVVVLALLLRDVIGFNLDSGIGVLVLENSLDFLIISIFVFGSLSLVSRISTKGKLAMACLVGFAPVVIGVFIPMLTPEHEAWSPWSSVTRTNQPPILFFANSIAVDEHFSQVDSLFEQARTEVDWTESTTTYALDEPGSSSLQSSID